MSPVHPFRQRSLRTWKEISSYFLVSVRTVQRWEKTEGLPVHREAGGQPVAYLDELESWRQSREAAIPKATISIPLAELLKRHVRLWVLGLAALLAVFSVIVYFTHLRKAEPAGAWWESGLPGVANADDWEWDFVRLDRSLVKDLDGDGAEEVLVNVYSRLDRLSPGRLECYDQQQHLRWTFQYGRGLSVEGREFDPNYYGRIIRHVVTPARSYVVTVAIHHLWHPAQVALLDPKSGALLEEYWHPGAISHCLVHDLDYDGVSDLIFAGVNNPGFGLGHAALFALSVPFSAEERKAGPLSDFTGGRELRYVLFPRPEPSWIAGKVFLIEDVRLVSQNRIEVRCTSTKAGGSLFYTFDGDLELVDFGISDGFASIYDRFWMEGLLDHRFGTEEMGCLSRIQHFPTAPDGNDPSLFQVWGECEYPPE